MRVYWNEYHRSFDNALKHVAVTAAGGQAQDAESALEKLCEWTREVRALDGSLHLIGNGASACMASHFAVDWTKNAGVRALAYNNVAFITAIGNDLGYEKLFSSPSIGMAAKATCWRPSAVLAIRPTCSAALRPRQGKRAFGWLLSPA